MELKKLSAVKPGTILVISGGIEREIIRVVDYKGATSGWVDLVSLAETGREVVLEIADRKVRVWLETSEMPLNAETMAPITEISVDVIVYGTSRFELDEGPSRAKITSTTKEGVEDGKWRFSVFCPEGDEKSDERICVEDKGGRLVVYHSVGFVSAKEIQVK